MTNYNVKSLDDGYGDVKFDSKGTPDLIPSFVTPFKPKPKEEFSTSKKEGKYIASIVDNQRYVVGSYAAKLDSNVRWVGGDNKHNDDLFPVLLKTTLGLMNTGPVETIDTLMMNLPIKSATNEREAFLKQTAEGVHEVALSYDGQSFTKKKIIVENVEVKKQPFGSACDVILDSQGQMKEPEIAQGYNVIVDIGARTMNVLTLDALEEQPDLTTHTNDGMFTAYQQVGNYLEANMNVTIPDGKLPSIIKNREIKGRDLSTLIDRVYSGHANRITNVLDQILINSWGFVTSIIFTGGGAHESLLKPYLVEAYQSKDINLLFLDRYANARGLRKYGLRQAAKNGNKKQSVQVKVGNHVYKG